MSGPDVIEPRGTSPDDRLLEEFLAGEGAVRGEYRRSATEQPPSALDARILALGQADATPASRPAVVRRAARWQRPLAAAAVLVLSLGVLLQVQRDPVAQKAVTASPAAEAGLSAAAPIAPAAPASGVTEEMVETPAARKPMPAVAEQSPSRKEARREAMAPRIDAEEARQRLAARRDSATQAAEALDADARSAAANRPLPASLPPPPAAAMPAAPTAAAALSDSAPEAATGSTPPAEPPAATAAGAPLAKAQARRSAPAAMAYDRPPTSALDRWAETCESSPLPPTGPVQWRGLVVQSWSATTGASASEGTLQFAPALSLATIQSALGALGERQEIAMSQCTGGTMVRALQSSPEGWQLRCQCAAVSR